MEVSPAESEVQTVNQPVEANTAKPVETMKLVEAKTAEPVQTTKHQVRLGSYFLYNIKQENLSISLFSW